MRERSAERRYEYIHAISARALNNAERVASRRTATAISHLGTVLPGPDKARGPLIPAASATVRPHRVQPLKAAPRSWSGRLPEASRTRGYEPRRAGAAPHSTNPTSLADALVEWGRGIMNGFLLRRVRFRKRIRENREYLTPK